LEIIEASIVSSIRPKNEPRVVRDLGF